MRSASSLLRHKLETLLAQNAYELTISVVTLLGATAEMHMSATRVTIADAL